MDKVDPLNALRGMFRNDIDEHKTCGTIFFTLNSRIMDWGLGSGLGHLCIRRLLCVIKNAFRILMGRKTVPRGGRTLSFLGI